MVWLASKEKSYSIVNQYDTDIYLSQKAKGVL